MRNVLPADRVLLRVREHGIQDKAVRDVRREGNEVDKKMNKKILFFLMAGTSTILIGLTTSFFSIKHDIFFGTISLLFTAFCLNLFADEIYDNNS